MIEFRAWMLIPVALAVILIDWAAYQLGEPQTVWLVNLIMGWKS
jgi:hypothetical protein